MRIGIVSDVHANLPALEAVIDDLPPVDALCNAGDIVGYNPWPAACVDAMVERDVPTVMGNHDRAVVANTEFRFNRLAAAGVEHARRELDTPALEWLEALPEQRTLFDGRVRLVHGHPDDPDRYTYPDEFAQDMLGDEDVLVLGHTHVQHVAYFDDGIVVNPGSVGQPRDGNPKAAYAVLDLDAMRVECHRVEYDVDRVVEAVEAAGLPSRIGERLRNGR
jgi:putative phosphoesterase